MRMRSSQVAAVLLLAYTILLIYWLFIGFGRTWDFEAPYRYNLHPFVTIQRYVHAAGVLPFSVWGVNLIGNIVVFIPAGSLLALVMRPHRRILYMLFYFVPALIALELLQMLLRAGSFDVDDVILNTAGACLGWLIVSRDFAGWRQRQT